VLMSLLTVEPIIVVLACHFDFYKVFNWELGKLSPFLKNTQKSRHFTQSVVAGVRHFWNFVI
jgi:hypothetical protein